MLKSLRKSLDFSHIKAETQHDPEHDPGLGVPADISHEEEVKTSHKRTAHIISSFDSGGTALTVVALIGTFLMSLLSPWDNPSTPRIHRDHDAFDYIVMGIELLTILAISLNICMCVQFMHHTKPENEKWDVVSRAEAWKNYNVFLVILVPFHIFLSVYWEADYRSASVALIFILFRIPFLIFVCRYVSELRRDLAAIRAMLDYCHRHSRVSAHDHDSDP